MIARFDTAVMLFIQNDLRCGALDAVMVIFSKLGDVGFFWLVLSAILLAMPKYRKSGLLMLFSVAVCWIASDVFIKNIVARPRPFEVMDGISVLVARPASYSFPSGHACAGFAGAYSLFKERGGMWRLLYMPAALIALSRPYVGVHYLTDIIAGAILGTAGSALIRRILISRDKKTSRTPGESWR